MHQSTSPSMSQTIWPRWSSRQFLSLSIVQTFLAPCDVWLFPKLKEKLWDNWGDDRGCDEGHWHARARGLRWGLPEVVGIVQQVHCSWRRLLRRGLEFHVSIKVPIRKKKSGNFLNNPCISMCCALEIACQDFWFLFPKIYTKRLFLGSMKPQCFCGGGEGEQSCKTILSKEP